MSTFNGKITEIPHMSVDRFDGENKNSLMYFLSHCHKDHMQGLEDWEFQRSLINRPDVYLYASSISVIILKELYPVIESKLKKLPLYNSSLIKFPYNNKFLTVTPLPAGHCPGSVMFLFELENKNVLYTGDYRVKANDLKKYNAFYSLGQLKTIHKLYLDTTFFKLSFTKLPSREKSLQDICRITKEWIQQSKKHEIKIITSASYGSEYLFIEIAKLLGMPIHVSSTAYNVYKCIPEMDEAVTINPKDTQIHSGCGGKYTKICTENYSLVRTIKPSVLYWENNNFSKGITAVTNNIEYYRVCYSCHASLEEIEDFLLFLKPLEVEPCVVPNGAKEKEEMIALLCKIMDVCKKESKKEEVKLLITQSGAGTSKQNTESDVITPEKNCKVLKDSLLDSPPKSFKRKRLWLRVEKSD